MFPKKAANSPKIIYGHRKLPGIPPGLAAGRFIAPANRLTARPALA